MLGKIISSSVYMSEEEARKLAADSQAVFPHLLFCVRYDMDEAQCGDGWFVEIRER